MPFNFRAVGVIPDGSITEAKLATNAVTSTKIADGAVIEDKIANDAVSLDKVVQAIAVQHFFGAETELSHTGVTETTVGEFNFIKDAAAQDANWRTLNYKIRLKSNDGGNQAIFRIYVDGNQVGSDANTNNTTYTEFGETLLDISALADGTHLVEAKLDNDQVTGIATLGQLDISLGKK